MGTYVVSSQMTVQRVNYPKPGILFLALYSWSDLSLAVFNLLFPLCGFCSPSPCFEKAQ